MKACLFILVIILALAPPLAKGQEAVSKADEQDWIQLFNGRNLDDWTVKITKHKPGENFSDTFRVENGLLKISYDKYETFDGQFGHLFYKDKFSYYLIAVEYRFVGQQIKDAPTWGYRNNGIMVHSQSPESMGLDQDFPTSIEVQMLGGDGVHERPNGNVCTPGTNIVMDGVLYTPHCYQLKAKTYHGDQWVRVVAEVLGSERVTHFVEGAPVITYTKPQLGGDVKTAQFANRSGELLSDGYIAIQAESAPTEFRKIELLNLVGCMNKKAKNFKSYYVKADNGKCRY
jgi:3-keto-disaccharide hydrolase